MSKTSAFELHPTVLSLGWATLNYHSTGSFGTSDKIKAITSYKDSSNSDVIVAVRLNASSKTTLYYIDSSFVVTSVGDVEAATSDLDRLAWARFRNRILFSTHADGLRWYDPVNHTTRKAGVTVPSTNATGAVGGGGALTGNYYLAYTFVNDQGHESNPSPLSSVVSPAAQSIDWSSIDTGPTGTSSRRLYRTTAGGGTYLFLATIANNIATTYADNIADTALGSEIASDNTIPPDTLTHIATTSTRVALLSTDGLTVYFSKIDGQTGIPNWEAYPTSLSIQLPFSGGDDAAKSIIYLNDDLYVFGRLNVYRIIGDIATGVKVEKVFSDLGIGGTFAFAPIPGKGLAFVTNDRKILLFNGSNIDDIGLPIQSTLNGMNIGVTSGGATNSTQFSSLEYITRLDTLYLAGFGVSGYEYNFQTKEWMGPMGYTYNIAHYSTFLQNLFGTQAEYYVNYWTQGKDTASTAFVQYFPYTPLPGFDIEYGWLEVILEAKPISSNVVPLVKVQYAYDGASIDNPVSSANPFFHTKYADFAKDFITIAALGNAEGGCIRSVRIPLNKVARTISLRIGPSADVASHTNGFEIYGLRLWCRPLREARDQHNVRQYP